MIWDGNGYPVKRCCAKCRTPYNCGNARCVCHDDPAFGSERPDLAPSAHQEASGRLGDRYENPESLDDGFWNRPTRRK